MTDQPADVQQAFANEVDRLRLSRGWTLADLADRSQLEVREIESILGGEDDVEFEAIILLAHAFGVSPGELVDGVGDRDEG